MKPTSSAAIAGFVTALSLGGAGALFLWLLRDKPDGEGGSAANQGEPVVVVAPGESGLEGSGVSGPGGEGDSSGSNGIAMEEGSGQAANREAQEPTEIVKSMVRGLALREGESWERWLKGKVPDGEIKALLGAVADERVRVDRQQPVTDLGRTEFVESWAVNLVHVASGESHRLVLVFGQDSAGKWILSEVAWPEALSAALGQSGAALSQAKTFLERLTALEFAGLSELVLEESVPNEKLAALGIIFDEARFRPASGGAGSLRPTNVTENHAWVIAKVHSETYGVDSEFGLEMKRVGDRWLVEQINLSRLMREFAGVAAREDAYNPPLVETPSGEESIVLYFGYDDDQLTPRSLKQLSVVAAMLKNRADKRIHVGGHADALGEDQYNDQLSQRRAKRVAEALKSFGVRSSQLEFQAFGERQPLRPNLNPDGTDNPSGRERNRRAEIYLDF